MGLVSPARWVVGYVESVEGRVGIGGIAEQLALVGSVLVGVVVAVVLVPSFVAMLVVIVAEFDIAAGPLDYFEEHSSGIEVVVD